MSRQVVAASDAIGLNARPLIEPWLADGDIRILPLREPWMRLQYGFIFLRDRSLSPAAQKFMELVRQIEAELSSAHSPVPSSSG